ncbi:MAG: hypothetical protein A2452_03500 [Candidatus Firestonebacteria bacterium RIFOXYC2_FULL_39_67]|nr:MAG: hypothetical protein A2536_02915 [Candidatus Firestonebacteria bacterium RIFOXYD2_FULL_39_29]OGF55333.1 MAG: hypothetical protein A2452_03500 [Candidatus Firestonebacteria bacterium RIFOXYC2_FULL_39_67]OGF57473.1 MAG: hypothetical protein A2497_06470 [Candidatus Firestonebacteria bacterium RifOxyC12_full_39_7]
MKKAKTAGIENIANKGKNAAFIYIVLVVIAAAVIFFVLQIKIKPVLNPFDSVKCVSLLKTEGLRTEFKVKEKVKLMYELRLENFPEYECIFKLNIVDPANVQVFSVTKPVKLVAKDGPKQLDFEYSIPAEAKIGVYKVEASFSDGKETIVSLLQENFSVIENVSAQVKILNTIAPQKPGTKIKIEAEVKNTGEKDYEFKTGLNILKDGKNIWYKNGNVFLRVNETKQIDFEYDLPASLIDGGKCIARVDAGKYSSAQIPFEILPFEVKGEILFKSADLGKVKLKEQVIAGVEVKNTGEIKKIFSLSAEIKGPWDYTYKFPMQKTDLAVNEAKQVELTRDIEDTCREGIYNIQLALYADVMGVSKKTDEKQFKYEVMDTSPEIKFLNFDLSAQAGEKVYLKIKVSDDREIKDVRITYINPEGRENKTVKMVNVQGTKLEGIYSYESAKFGKSGKFSFYIEATDSKPQTTKTEPYNVTVLKP